MKDTADQGVHLDERTGAVESAIGSLQFIVAGLQTHPVDPANEHAATTTAARLDKALAGLGTEPVDVTAAATHLIEVLVDTATPLRNDQARSIAEACTVLGVSATLTQCLAPSTGLSAGPADRDTCRSTNTSPAAGPCWTPSPTR